MATLHGTIVDTATNQPIDAKVHVLNAMGTFCHPEGALLKRGPGRPFFFSNGEFEVNIGRGRTDVLVERGTEYEPSRLIVDAPEKGVVDVEVYLNRWHHPQQENWYPGNTHIHYDENETQPDDRLAVDCSVEGYNVTVVSVLDRRQLPYASNKYPIGVMNEFTTAHHVLDIGEENRHYGEKSPWGFGYGHVMFLNIRNLVQPVSRGHILTSQFDPDYPPLCYCCDDAREQGGLVIWCHNGRGMEAPVAAALGKLDAFNLFDPFWMDPEYDLWYKLLNCGIQLPASTGTDWFVCANNRVYVQTEGTFSYANWIEGMKNGRTYITNGPAIDMKVNDLPIGATIPCTVGGRIEISVNFQSHYPVDAVEIVSNGIVVERREFPSGLREGSMSNELTVEADGWVAARIWGNTRDSFDQAIFAHTSPTYLHCGRLQIERESDARFFMNKIDDSLSWINTVGRYNTDKQRNDVKDLFKRGREVFETLYSTR